MANNIVLTSKHMKLLDEVYAKAATSSILDAPAVFVQETANAKEIKIAKIAMDGAADYNRASGFVDGDVNLVWETHEFTHDRGRSFTVDDMDNKESLGIVSSALMAQFLRTKIVPETDAIRYSQYNAKAGTKVTGTLSKSNVEDALRTSLTTMEENEVPAENMIIFMPPTVLDYLEASLGRSLPNAEGNVDGRIRNWDGRTVVKVPTKRFNTSIILNDGKTSGQEKGGYTTNGQDINFMVIDKQAVLQIGKHTKIREFSPDINQKSDGWKFDYRFYHDAWALENKTVGIYSHAKAST